MGEDGEDKREYGDGSPHGHGILLFFVHHSQRAHEHVNQPYGRKKADNFGKLVEPEVRGAVLWHVTREKERGTEAESE